MKQFMCRGGPRTLTIETETGAEVRARDETKGFEDCSGKTTLESWY